jgi:hypothetical protein
MKKIDLKKTKEFWNNNIFLILSLIPLFLIILFQPQQNTLFPIFFGDESIALFDLWSIQHFLSGVLIISFFLLPKNTVGEIKNWQKIIPFILFVALSWEAMEIYFETGVIIKGWTGSEHWSNRIITDPLMALLGGVVGYITKDSWRVAIVPAIFWLILKIFLI